MIGPNLIKLRKKAKLTQEEASRKIGVHRGTYANYEAGNREPDLETLQKIADLYGVSIDYLIGRTDDPTPNIEQVDDDASENNTVDLANKKIQHTWNGRMLTTEQMKQLRLYIDKVLLADEDTNDEEH